MNKISSTIAQAMHAATFQNRNALPTAVEDDRTLGEAPSSVLLDQSIEMIEGNWFCIGVLKSGVASPAGIRNFPFHE